MTVIANITVSADVLKLSRVLRDFPTVEVELERIRDRCRPRPPQVTGSTFWLTRKRSRGTELSVGRQHLHALASLFYPAAPNDIAPCAYNDPDPVPGLPKSPLSPPRNPQGLEWQ